MIYAFWLQVEKPFFKAVLPSFSGFTASVCSTLSGIFPGKTPGEIFGALVWGGLLCTCKTDNLVIR